MQTGQCKRLRSEGRLLSRDQYEIITDHYDHSIYVRCFPDAGTLYFAQFKNDSGTAPTTLATTHFLHQHLLFYVLPLYSTPFVLLKPETSEGKRTARSTELTPVLPQQLSRAPCACKRCVSEYLYFAAMDTNKPIPCTCIAGLSCTVVVCSFRVGYKEEKTKTYMLHQQYC